MTIDIADLTNANFGGDLLISLQRPVSREQMREIQEQFAKAMNHRKVMVLNGPATFTVIPTVPVITSSNVTGEGAL